MFHTQHKKTRTLSNVMYCDLKQILIITGFTQITLDPPEPKYITRDLRGLKTVLSIWNNKIILCQEFTRFSK